jgi:hypothetical protein
MVLGDIIRVKLIGLDEKGGNDVTQRGIGC